MVNHPRRNRRTHNSIHGMMSPNSSLNQQLMTLSSPPMSILTQTQVFSLTRRLLTGHPLQQPVHTTHSVTTTDSGCSPSTSMSKLLRATVSHPELNRQAPIASAQLVSQQHPLSLQLKTANTCTHGMMSKQQSPLCTNSKTSS